ncbi:aminoglycoside phosphotransferase family protein [Kitasatospora sp. NPDC048545]|uniref:phosphotransferase family protein n=1 Tax=Kitasatospora sp. NPDC048545 TaxID=3157208 RepID=UPI0033F55F55
MEFLPIERAAEAFQQPVTADEIRAVCLRVFGADALSARELGSGMYNNTYRVAVTGHERPVILRVAPEPGRQFRSELQLMRNEYASVPWFTAIAPLMPRVIAADWSHEVIGRDYMVQTHLDGVPAPEGLGRYSRTSWPSFFRQLGSIARKIHGVRGPHFGPIAGPAYSTWSAAVAASLEDITADLDAVGLDSADLRKVAEVARQHRAVLDEITEPRCLSGDLWTVNVMLAESAPEPLISGVLDLDRTWWGDPAADWTIRMALAKADEREAFWESYGPQDRSPAAVLRSRIYEARHIGAIRLERHRLGNVDTVPQTYELMQNVLDRLQA